MNKENLLKILESHGFSEKIVNAFREVRREDFVPLDMKKYSYADDALPIGYGQTISQPSTIAFMLDLLEIRNNQKILEVGSGSGYVLALISEISKDLEIYGVERMEELAKRSKEALKGKSNITIIRDSGYGGLPVHAPFDRILVSAAANEIPKDLVSQLKTGGILVMPLGNSIIRLRKNKTVDIEEYPGFVFVPLMKNQCD